MLQSVEDFLFGPAPIQWVQQLIGLGHPRPFEILSLLGDTWGIILVIGVAMWLWGRETTYALLGIVAVGTVTKELLSMTFSVPRPDSSEIVVYEHLQIASFPSGHVYQILAPWGLLYAYGLVPLLIPAAVGVLVSMARLYLGVHFLGDLVFAVIFAILLVWGYRHLWPRVQTWLYSRSQKFYLIVGVITIGIIVASMMLRLNNPRRWEILGMAVGATLGFILEARYLRYRPLRTSWKQQALMVALGASGILACLIIDRLADPQALTLGLFTAGGAVLWTVLGAPYLFTKMNWAEQQPRRPAARST